MLHPATLLVWFVAILMSPLSAAAVVLEAEDAAFSIGFQVGSNQPGYTGTGYVDFVNEGDVTWTYHVEVQGKYDLVFRYALGNEADRPLNIEVDGNLVRAGLSFPNTGSGSTWQTTDPISVMLTVGAHAITARTTGSSGANIDSLVIRLETVETPGVPPLTGIDFDANMASNQAPVDSAKVTRIPLSERYVDLTSVTLILADGSEQDITDEVSLGLLNNAGVAKLDEFNSGREGCAVQFRSAPDFIQCEEQWQTCRFNARTYGGTCNQLCTRFNTTCVAAIDNAGVTCVPNLPNADTCETPRDTEICVCERPDNDDFDDNSTYIRLLGPGIVDVQVRWQGTLISEFAIETFIPGSRCDDDTNIVDCEGRCVDADTVSARLGDGSCDDDVGDSVENPIDLSCSAFNNDRGDCESP
jgi:hypothetical protein